MYWLCIRLSDDVLTNKIFKPLAGVDGGMPRVGVVC